MIANLPNSKININSQKSFELAKLNSNIRNSSQRTSLCCWFSRCCDKNETTYSYDEIMKLLDERINQLGCELKRKQTSKSLLIKSMKYSMCLNFKSKFKLHRFINIKNFKEFKQFMSSEFRYQQSNFSTLRSGFFSTKTKEMLNKIFKLSMMREKNIEKLRETKIKLDNVNLIILLIENNPQDFDPKLLGNQLIKTLTTFQTHNGAINCKKKEQLCEFLKALLTILQNCPMYLNLIKKSAPYIDILEFLLKNIRDNLETSEQIDLISQIISILYPSKLGSEIKFCGSEDNNPMTEINFDSNNKKPKMA